MDKVGKEMARLGGDGTVEPDALQNGAVCLGKLNSLLLSPEAVCYELIEPEDVVEGVFMNDSKANAQMDKYGSMLTDVNAGPKDWFFMWRAAFYSTSQEITGVPTRLEMKKAAMTLERFSLTTKVKSSDHFLKEINSLFDVDSRLPMGGGNRLVDFSTTIFTATGDAYLD